MPVGEIITFTPEQGRLWEGLVKSDPYRVVHALALGFHNRPNPWGDTLADFYAALAAVDDAAIGKDLRWQRLVDFGVAHVLCINVISTKMKNWLQTLPSGSKDAQNIPSSFSKPLTVLLNAAIKFSSPPNGTDLKVIEALKKHWSVMVIRLLKEPENSLKPGEPYTFERATATKLFGRTLIADPSFTCVLDNETDYTISLISRYWIYSTDAADIFLNTSVLSNLLDADTEALRIYRASHPFTPTTFIRVIQGASCIRNLISALASHLDYYDGIDGFVEVSLLGTFWRIAIEGTHPLYTDLLCAHRESLCLWTSVLSLLRRAINGGPRPADKGRNEKHIGIIIPLIHHMANTILYCNDMCSLEQSAALIDCWARADLFGTLDVVVPFCSSEPRLSFLDDFVGDLSRIFHGIKVTLQNVETLAPALRSQFPRARSLRALMDLSRSIPNNNDASSTQATVAAWMLFRDIESACFLEGDCARRDCDRKCTARCVACKRAGYCGVDCQKSDWQEHKLVCKLKMDVTPCPTSG